jgi:anti-anti-sigma factor
MSTPTHLTHARYFSTERHGLRLGQAVTESFAVVLHVTGELDLATVPAFDRQLRIAEEQIVPPAPLVVDLTAVGFVSTLGLRVLVEHDQSCEAVYVPFRLVTDVRLRRTLRITGLDSSLAQFRTVREALAADRRR